MTADLHRDLRRAELLADVRRWDEASEVLARVLAGNPSLVRAMCLLAYCQHEQGRYADMLDTARLAVAAEPDNEWAHRLVAAACQEAGRPDEAVAAAREAVRIAPRFWRTHRALAAALRRAGDHRGALAAAEEARRLAPEEVSPHITHAAVLGDLGLLHDAEASLRQALAVAPDDPTAHNDLGYLQLRRGRVLRALRSFATAGGRAPDWRLPAANAGVAMGSLGWHLCLGAAMTPGPVSLLAWDDPVTRAAAGTAVLAAYAGIVFWVLRLLPAGLRAVMVRGAPRRGSTWVAATLLGFTAAVAYLPVPGALGLCVTTLAIIGVSLTAGRFVR